MPEAMSWINFNVVVIMVISLVALIVLGVFVLIGIKMARNGGRKKGRHHRDDEEAQLIQEIYQGLSRMEGRVEALETILYDREKEGDPDGP